MEHRGKPVRRLDAAVTTAARQAEPSYPVCMYDVRHVWITTTLDAGIEPSAIAYMAGTSVEMTHANCYEPHAAERGRAVQVLPRLETTPCGEPAHDKTEGLQCNFVVHKKKAALSDGLTL